MKVVLSAKSHSICMLDGVWNNFADQAGFDAEALQSLKMAFDGKTLIHHFASGAGQPDLLTVSNCGEKAGPSSRPLSERKTTASVSSIWAKNDGAISL